MTRATPGINQLAVETGGPTSDAFLILFVHVLNRTKNARVLGGTGPVRGSDRFAPHTHEHIRGGNNTAFSHDLPNVFSERK